MARLTTKVNTYFNVVVFIKEQSGKYTWRIVKAVVKPRPAKAKAGDRDHDGVSFGASKSKEVLVDHVL